MVNKSKSGSRKLEVGSIFLCGLAFALLAISYSLAPAFSQQPQAPAGTPLYSANAKYVNGMAPGYWATEGSGLTMNLSAGTSYCGNPPAPVSYPGGSLALAASTTNYIYLDPANNCAPTAGTSPFSAGQIPIAKVVTGASSITSIIDARTWFQAQPCVTGSAGDLHCSSLGTNQSISLTPSGSGATVITNLVDKGGQIFNIKAYGAVGDGVTDDSGAFQAAYNAAVAAGGGTVFIPPSSSCYLLNTGINMTSTGATGRQRVIIQGATHGYGGSTSPAAQICGNTGNVVFDVSGSGSISFEHVWVTSQSGVTNPSLIGILAARNSSNNGADNITVTDCLFDMVRHSSGATYSFGAYLYGAELNYYTRDSFAADYPLVVVGVDTDFNVTSPFITLGTGSQSETQNAFTDMELDTSGLGNAAYFDNTQDDTLTGHSWNLNTVDPYPATLQQYALSMTNTLNFFVKWRQEGFPSFLQNKLSMINSWIQGDDAPFTNASTLSTVHGVEFIDASSVISHVNFAIRDDYPFATTNFFFDSTVAGTTGVSILDDVDFSCGHETNCVQVPVGNYAPGFPTYWHELRWSGESNNQYPVIKTGTAMNGFPVTGTFSVPASAVAANSCTGLSAVAAATTDNASYVKIYNAVWYNLLVVADNIAGGSFSPRLCNPTSASITPGAGTIRWSVEQ